VRQRKPNTWLSDGQLRDVLGLTTPQWRSLKAAAEDASMPLHDYIRLMLLVAAGHGGVLDHVERAINGSWDVDNNGGK
jgi:hypothetical protein